MVLDLLGEDRSLWPALRVLIERPGFDAIRLDPSLATRLAARETWLQELSTWCNQNILTRTGDFLDGLLQLTKEPTPQPAARHEGRDGEQRGADHATPPPSVGVEWQSEIRSLSRQGIEASNRGDHRQAITLFSQALQVDPADTLIYLQRASVHGLLGDTEAAILDFSAVLRLEPGHLEALAQRGKALAALGRYEEAKQDWQLASDRGHPKAIRWLRRKQERERGRPQTSKAGTTPGESGDQQRTGHAPSEETTSREAAQQAAMLVEQGLTAQATGEIQRAIELFSQALQLDSNQAKIHALRGALHARAGRLSQAAVDLTAALRLDPSNLGTLTQRARIHEALKNLPEARRDWQAAAERGHSEAVVWMGSDYYRRARTEAARNNHRHAIALATKAIALGEPRPEDFLLRGCSYQSLQEHQHAYDDFSRVLQLSPDHIEALLSRGHALQALNRREDAQRDWKRAAELGCRHVPGDEGEGRPSTAKSTGLILAWLCIGLILVAILCFWGLPLSVKAGIVTATGVALQRSSRGPKQ